MKAQAFEKHVTGWINSYTNIDSLSWLESFVNQSSQSEVLKLKLIQKIDQKKAVLEGRPYFVFQKGSRFLADKTSGHPELWMSKHDAQTKVTALRILGYDVTLFDTGVFYKVHLLSDEKVNFVEHAK